MKIGLSGGDLGAFLIQGNQKLPDFGLFIHFFPQPFLKIADFSANCRFQTHGPDEKFSKRLSSKRPISDVVAKVTCTVVFLAIRDEMMDLSG
jgi:hypothetical protein